MLEKFDSPRVAPPSLEAAESSPPLSRICCRSRVPTSMETLAHRPSTENAGRPTHFTLIQGDQARCIVPDNAYSVPRSSSIATGTPVSSFPTYWRFPYLLHLTQRGSETSKHKIFSFCQYSDPQHRNRPLARYTAATHRVGPSFGMHPPHLVYEIRSIYVSGIKSIFAYSENDKVRNTSRIISSASHLHRVKRDP